MMIWAPSLAATCARSSCFWIIDSLSPVQLAWTSAARIVRGIAGFLHETVGRGLDGTPGPPSGTVRCDAWRAGWRRPAARRPPLANGDPSMLEPTTARTLDRAYALASAYLAGVADRPVAGAVDP